MTSTSILNEKSVQELEADIATQKAIFNDLRAQGAPLEEARKQLGDLQKTLALVKGAGKEKEKKAEGSGGQHQVDGKPKKKERLLLKTAKVESCLVFYRALMVDVRYVGHKGLWSCRDVLSRTH
jgi:histidyl-tRNA synthetase